MATPEDNPSFGGTTTQQSSNDENQLRPVTDLPSDFQVVFSPSFSQFNLIQSKLFPFLIEDDKSLVINSPTGSGKTVLLEMAIIRELMKLAHSESPYTNLHVLYLAPLKAIVEEKCTEWQTKFAPFGIKCFQLTGDTEFDDVNSIQISNYRSINIVLATPEKFDHILRTDPRSRLLLSILNLIMIDEVHILADKTRGDVLEALITRIKALRNKTSNNPKSNNKNMSTLRFIAISATVPNVADIASWLDSGNSLGIVMSPDWRPVKLEMLVLGYEANKGASTSDYRFDIQLSYKLENVIRTHSASKPTLVFCSTRKGVEFAAKILASSNATYFTGAEQREEFFYQISLLVNENFENNSVFDNEGYFRNVDLKTALQSGVGFYHSGLEYSDRRLLEKLFVKSLIPVLVSTSSLAMGVNLPAHLVVIKNTVQYQAGTVLEYDSSAVLQMIGRAGRPQFDKTAKAIIMTHIDKKTQYESLLSSQKVIESNLSRTLIEQMTVEIVMRSIIDTSSAVDWICSTFMFIRIISNPTYYGSRVTQGDPISAMPLLTEWCTKSIDKLSTLGLIIRKSADQDHFDPTHLARIISRNSISLSTTELMLSLLTEGFNLQTLLEEMCKFKELNGEVILRVSEKRFLNEYNKNNRYKFKDRIKDSKMKINCLIQATFQSQNIESSLLQDSTQLFRCGQRVTKCLAEVAIYLLNLSENEREHFSLKITKLDMPFETLISAFQLLKAFKVKLWHDSPFVSKQLTGIGQVMSGHLVERGLDSFEKLLDTNPRDIEFCLKRNPPFGSYLLTEIKSLPKYNLSLTPVDIENSDHSAYSSPSSVVSVFEVQLKLSLEERHFPPNGKVLLNPQHHSFILLVGCQECNELIFLHRSTDETLGQTGTFSKRILIMQTNLMLRQEIENSSCATSQNMDSQYEAIFEMSSQAARASGSNGNKRKPTTSKAAAKKAKKDKVEIGAVPKRIHSGEFMQLIDQLGVNVNPKIDQPGLHCTYVNHRAHTIHGLVISESFAGLDVEERVCLQTDSRSMVNLSTKSSRQIQSTIVLRDNQLGLSTSTSGVYSASTSRGHLNDSFSSETLMDDSIDEDLNKLLDDFDENVFAKASDSSNQGEEQLKDKDWDILSDLPSSEIDSINQLIDSAQSKVNYESPSQASIKSFHSSQMFPQSSQSDWQNNNSAANRESVVKGVKTEVSPFIVPSTPNPIKLPTTPSQDVPMEQTQSQVAISEGFPSQQSSFSSQQSNFSSQLSNFSFSSQSSVKQPVSSQPNNLMKLLEGFRSSQNSQSSQQSQNRIIFAKPQQPFGLRMPFSIQAQPSSQRNQLLNRSISKGPSKPIPSQSKADDRVARWLATTDDTVSQYWTKR